MTNKVILPLMDGRWLALSPDDFQNAIEQGARMTLGIAPTKANDEPQWLSAKEMAKATAMSETYWQEEARCGRCPSRRFGRSLRFPASYLQSLDSLSIGQSDNGAANA